MELNRKHPAIIVLKSLLQGNSVKLGKYEYALSEDGDLGTKFTSDSVFRIDMGVGAFIKLCEELTDEDLVGVVFTNVMQSRYWE